MQFKITLKVLRKGCLIPLSYQYELSSWIYKVIYEKDNDLARFLHDKGYSYKNRKFKFFTFSHLNIYDRVRIDDRIKIHSEYISFVISFFIEDIALKMIGGIFQNKKFELGDRITKGQFFVKSVNQIELTIPSESIQLKTTSPLVVVEQTQNEQGKTRHKYLHPNDIKFQDCFIQNLINKYYVARQYQLIPEIKGLEEVSLHVCDQKIKKKGIRIKAHTRGETKVIGYECGFELNAPKPLIRMGILSGFGRMNANGFGATKIIN